METFSHTNKNMTLFKCIYSTIFWHYLVNASIFDWCQITTSSLFGCFLWNKTKLRYYIWTFLFVPQKPNFWVVLNLSYNTKVWCFYTKIYWTFYPLQFKSYFTAPGLFWHLVYVILFYYLISKLLYIIFIWRTLYFLQFKILCRRTNEWSWTIDVSKFLLPCGLMNTVFTQKFYTHCVCLFCSKIHCTKSNFISSLNNKCMILHTYSLMWRKLCDD